MGIYIKNVNMPTERNEMILRIQPDGAVFDKYAHYIGMFASYVLPHGRLIDADKLGIMDAEKQAYEAYLREKSEFFVEEPLLEYMRGRLEGLTDASGRVKFAPTVIPAEEDE